MNRLFLSAAALFGAVAPMIIDSALKGVVLLAVAALTALALYRMSAAARHLVWLVSVVALLVVPVLSIVLPEWRILPHWRTKVPDAVAPSVAAVAPSPTSPSRLVADPSPAPEPRPAPEFPAVAVERIVPALPATSAAKEPPHVFAWLPLAWSIGLVLLLMRLVLAQLILRRSARQCTALPPESPLRAALQNACKELGVRPHVTLILDKKRSIPLVWGVLRPHLLLPSEAQKWSPDQLRSVLLHELAHLKRHDPLVQWLTQIACALHWWNPLVWFAAWRIHVERERACDDLVLASGVRPSTYAEHLLDVATKLSPVRWTQACGLAMARKSSLECRLLAVLSEKIDRRRVTRSLIASAVILSAAIAVPIAMLRAAEEKWNSPSGAHVGTNDFSAYCVHDGKDASFVIAYHGFTGSSSAHDSNPKTRTWTDSGTLTAKKPGIALSFLRTHVAPGKLSITTAPAESRDLSKPAPEPRNFGQKEYDLEKGRVFLLTDSGFVRQLDLPTPIVTDQESSKKLAALIAAIPPQEREAHNLNPMHKDARTLYEIWQRHSRLSGDIPGALIGELAAAVKVFIGYNPTWETVPKLKEILPRLDATHDWKAAEAIALLDEVAAVQDSPLQTAAEKMTASTISRGKALPEKFANVAWGDTQPNGLRAAWVLELVSVEHRMGTALKARLLVQNTGKLPVMVRVPTWHQGGVSARDATGAAVEVSGIEWTTMARLIPVRLGPGEFIEINAPGVGLGKDAGRGPWAGPRVGSNVLAKDGTELTLTHGPLALDGSGVGMREDAPHLIGPGWWQAHMKARLARELPLPATGAKRTHLLDRAMRELFATTPTADEINAFATDQTDGAFDALVQRLAARADVVEFAGSLPTASLKFRVLPADPAADKTPRVVLGPGEYPLSGGTATSGAVTLKIVGRPVGDRRTNDVQLLFEATEATGKLPPDSHKLEVPDGWGTWAIVCRPGAGFFYLLHKGGARKIDFTNPSKVTDTPATDLPPEFHDEVKRQFDIAGVPAEQQAEVFEKPAPPAAANPEAPGTATTPEPRTAEAPAKTEGNLVNARATSLPGTWALAGGVSLHIYGEVFHGSDVATSAILSWPALGHRPAQHWSTWIAGDAFAARSLYAVAWDAQHEVLWIASRDVGSNAKNAEGKPIANRFKRVDFSNPNLVTETSSNGWPMEHPPSAEVMAQMATLMEVPQDPQPKASTLYSWSTSGNPERINLANVQNLSVQTDRAGTLTVSLQSEKKTCTENELAETIKALALNWEMKRASTAGDLKPSQRVTISTSADFPAEALQKIIQGCTKANFGPLASGSAVAALLPKHESAQKLLKSWQRYARSDGKIPGALIASLADVVDWTLWTDGWLTPQNADQAARLAALSFTHTRLKVTGPKAAPYVVKLTALRSRIDGSRDWTPAEAIAMLDELTAITTEPVYLANRKTPLDDEALVWPKDGDGPPKARTLRPGTEEALTWGEPVGGLRAALVRLAPERELAAGTVVDFNLVVQNVSQVAVQLNAFSPMAARLNLRLADGTTVKVPQTTRAESRMDKYTLQPRQVAVMSLFSVGIGERDVNAKSEHGRSVGYWGPAGKAIVGFNAEATFPSLSPGFWSGTLFAPFTVAHGTPAGAAPAQDSGDGKAPRTATAPGRYVLGDGVHLQITQTTVNPLRPGDFVPFLQDKAKIIFPAPKPEAAREPKPHEIALPNGSGTYGIVWERGAGTLWVLQKDLARKYDFTDPWKVQETCFAEGGITNIPEPLREAMKKVFAVAEAPVQKHVPETPNGAAADATPAGELVFIPRNAERPFPVLYAGDGVTLVIHEDGGMKTTRVRIRYTAEDGIVTGHDVDVANDFGANREQWAMLWVRGTKTFWHVNGEFDGKRLRLHRTDFADPRRIVTAYDGNYEGEPLDALGIPADVLAKFYEHFGVVNPKPVDKSNGLPDVAGEFIAAARPVNLDGSLTEVPVKPDAGPDRRWKVQFVDAATGKVVPSLRAKVISRTVDGARITYVTWMVSSGTLERNLGGDEYAWVSIEDEKMTNAEEGERLFGNVPADVSAVEKHTNPNAPFIVKVKTRQKTAVAAGAVPKLPKLPDDAYTKPGVHCQKFREEDAKRPGGELMGDVLEPSKPGDLDKEPLVLGVRTAIDAQWRIGGTAKAALVVRNRSDSDVKFSYADMLDSGLSITAIDEQGNEHRALVSRTPFGFVKRQQMLLPGSYMATVREFTIRFDAERSDAGDSHIVAFHLPAGKYKLRCKWSDASPTDVHEGEWMGELLNEELVFTLTAAAGPAVQTPLPANGNIVSAEPGGVSMVTSASYKTDSYPLAEGLSIVVRSEIYHGPNTSTDVVAHWAATENRAAAHAVFQVASDTMGNRQPWAVLWENGTPALWFATGKSYHMIGEPAGKTQPLAQLVRIDLRDPENLVSHEFSGIPEAGGPSAAVLEKLGARMTWDGTGTETTRTLRWAQPTTKAGKTAGILHVFTRDAGKFQVSNGKPCDLDGLRESIAEEGKEYAGAPHQFTLVGPPSHWERMQEAAGRLRSWYPTIAGGEEATPADTPPAAASEYVTVTIEKDGALSYDRRAVKLAELKTIAAENAKKWFTIRADEEVPYARAAEVLDSLRAAGVAEITFSEGRMGDGRYRVANRTGNYEFDATHKFSICMPSGRQQWFTVIWPAKDGRPARRLRFYPELSAEGRTPWAVAWEPGTNELWWVDAGYVGRMTLADPGAVVVTREGRMTASSSGLMLPEEVRTQFRRLGIVVGQIGKIGPDTSVPVSSQETLVAEVLKADGTAVDHPQVRPSGEWSEAWRELSTTVAAARGTPEAELESLIAWGDTNDGLRSGVLMTDRVKRGGRTVARLVVRNVSDKSMTVNLSPVPNRIDVEAKAADGTRLQVHKVVLRGTDPSFSYTFKPGQQLEFAAPPIQFGVGRNADGKVLPPDFPICGVETGPGTVSVRYSLTNVHAPDSGDVKVVIE